MVLSATGILYEKVVETSFFTAKCAKQQSGVVAHAGFLVVLA